MILVSHVLKLFVSSRPLKLEGVLCIYVLLFHEGQAENCCGFVNRSAIGVGVWRFVEGGEHGGAIRDGGSTSLPGFRSCNSGETLRAAIIHYMATSARLQ
jgi:hypothetical protein